jgi:hypothetical protein
LFLLSSRKRGKSETKLEGKGVCLFTIRQGVQHNKKVFRNFRPPTGNEDEEEEEEEEETVITIKEGN